MIIDWEIDHDLEIITGWTDNFRLLYFGARVYSDNRIGIEVFSETNPENKIRIAEFKQKKNEIKK